MDNDELNDTFDYFFTSKNNLRHFSSSPGHEMNDLSKLLFFTKECNINL